MMRVLRRRWQIVVVVGVTLLALAPRYAGRNCMNGDLYSYVVPWYDYIVGHGGFRALADGFYNYSPPYMYLLALASYLHPYLSAIVAIKAVSVAFDFLAALIMYRLVRLKYEHGPVPWLAYAAVLLAPTVIANSAYWGQCDILYTTCLLACIYFACAGKPALSMLSFGIALAFKAQAVFLGPFVLILFLKRVIPWRYALLAPVAFLLMMLPAVIVGRPLPELLGVYAHQAGMYRELCKAAPNLWTFVPDTYYTIGTVVGTLVAAVAGLGMALAAWRSKVRLDADLLVLAATVSVALMPFLLPKMHDRYFFPADVVSIALAFHWRRLRPVPLLFQFTSMIAYSSYVLGEFILPLPVAAIGNTLVVGALLVAYVRALYPSPTGETLDAAPGAAAGETGSA